jgi:hypothetical protein
MNCSGSTELTRLDWLASSTAATVEAGAGVASYIGNLELQIRVNTRERRT